MILPPLKDQRGESEIERELYHALSQCVRCAVCLPTCPTYQETLNEGHSPRGRVSLVRALHDDEGDASKRLNEYIYGCLECRACETACPNDVVFHKIVEYGKERLHEADLTPRTGRFFKWLFLKHVFRDSRSMNRLMDFLRLYQKSGLQAVVRATRLLKILPWNLYGLERMMPKLGRAKQTRKKRDYRLIPAGNVRGEVDFFTGCIADHWLRSANIATLRLLLRAGYLVRIPTKQQCCGALHVHLGEIEGGRELARRNMEAFGIERESLILSNAAGCGAALKEYEEILDHTDDKTLARTFSSRVRDFTEFLAKSIDTLPEPEPFKGAVTYDDPCHMIHAQGVSAAPRRLIRHVPGVNFIELVEGSWCCGSAGVYNVINYEMSQRILARKLEHVRAAGADVLLTANPGCYLQLAAGVREAGIDIEVMHLAEFLDRQYPGDPTLAPESDTPPWS